MGKIEAEHEGMKFQLEILAGLVADATGETVGDGYDLTAGIERLILERCTYEVLWKQLKGFIMGASVSSPGVIGAAFMLLRKRVQELSDWAEEEGVDA